MSYKYIMIKSGAYRFPVIFPSNLVHADVAAALFDAGIVPHIKNDPKPFVESAGEIGTLNVMGVGGRSSTLDVNSHDEDRQIINMHPYAHGIGYKDD